MNRGPRSLADGTCLFNLLNRNNAKGIGSRFLQSESPLLFLVDIQLLGRMLYRSMDGWRKAIWIYNFAKQLYRNPQQTTRNAQEDCQFKG